MPNICLYAEVLTHIRQLTLHASLETSGDETPRIDVSSDKKVITVVHGDESSSLFLPTQISGTANITFLSPKKTELTARVQIEDLVAWKEFDQNAIEAPWDAVDLGTESAIQCKDCRTSVLLPGTIAQWKDLPNQDWADIMDLWYCHKPHAQHDSDEQKQAAEAKGYSARSKLASTPSIGMVDVVSFVLHPEDCKGIRISDVVNENDLKPQKVSCSTCNVTIGAFSQSDNLVKLYKSNLAVSKATGEHYHSFPASTFICAQLLSLVESSPIRKVVVHSSNERSEDSDQESTVSPGTTRNPILLNGSGKPSELAQADKNVELRGHISNEDDDTTQLYSRDDPSTTSEPGRESTDETSTNARSLAATVEDEADSPKKQPHITSKEESASTARPQTKSRKGQREQVAYESKSNNLQQNRSNTTISDTANGINTPTTAEKPPPPPPGLLLWIFNPNIYYSSSLHPENRTTAKSKSNDNSTSNQAGQSHLHLHQQPEPQPQSRTPAQTQAPAQAHRAMKVFYQPLTDPQAHLDSTPATQIEELTLPSQRDITSLHEALVSSTAILPGSARQFQDWHVGLLDRYERLKTAEDVMLENPLTRRAADDSELDLAAGKGTGRAVTKLDLPAGYQELYL